MSTTRNIIEGIKNVTSEGVTKAQVGLGSVDNTTDANKPVSTATQTALDLKAPIASPVFTGNLKAERLIANGSGGISTNVAVGEGSLAHNTTGHYNTATGFGALSYNTTGNHNTAVGIYAQHNIIDSIYNTAVGYASLYSSASGELNTALGADALRFKQDGTYNTDLSRCTGLGYNTRVGGNNATAIGYEASAPANCVALGTSNERTLVGGAVDNGTDRLQVNGSISSNGDKRSAPVSLDTTKKVLINGLSSNAIGYLAFISYWNTATGSQGTTLLMARENSVTIISNSDATGCGVSFFSEDYSLKAKTTSGTVDATARVIQ